MTTTTTTMTTEEAIAAQNVLRDQRDALWAAIESMPASKVGSRWQTDRLAALTSVERKIRAINEMMGY